MRMLRKTVCLQRIAALAFFVTLALSRVGAQSAHSSTVLPPSVAANTPNWPVNQAPKPAVVQWDSHGLSIHAQNSSLKEILNEIAEKTGAKLEGFVPGGSTDQRVFGEYGPGTTDNVLAQLLNGSGYNVMMIGDQGQGTPQEIVLSKPSAASSEPPPPPQNSEDEDYEQQDQPVEQPPSPVRQPLMRFRQMQEMRQRQLQQQQQQNNGQQQY